MKGYVCICDDDSACVEESSCWVPENVAIRQATGMLEEWHDRPGFLEAMTEHLDIIIVAVIFWVAFWWILRKFKF